MWAVSKFEVTNGLLAAAAPAMNRTCYRYKDAMVSDWGRGFQGFRFITTEEQLPATGDELTAGAAGCGGICSPNNRTTQTEFHQEFPLTGRLTATTVALKGGGLLSQTLTWWHQTPGQNPGTWLVYGTGTVESAFEPTGGIARTSRIVEVSPVNGSPTATCTIVENGAARPDGTLANVVSGERRSYDSPDTTSWWLDRLNARDLYSDFSGAQSPLLDATQAFASSAQYANPMGAPPGVCSSLG